MADDYVGARVRFWRLKRGLSQRTLAGIRVEVPGLCRPASKVPRTVQLVPALPRTPTGKLRRHIVRTGSW